MLLPKEYSALKLQYIDIDELIDNALSILQEQVQDLYGATNLMIHRSYGSLPKVECIPALIQQALITILHNIFDALDKTIGSQSIDSFQLSIKTTTTVKTDAKVVIFIADHISDSLPSPPTYCLNAHRSSSLPQFGLDLSYYILVERHGGTLIWDSSPEQGTEFIIVLPCHQLSIL